MSPAPRVALVTGAGRGIGRAVTRSLSTAGFTVALTARTRDELEETASTCTTPSLIVPLDLTAPGAVDDLFATVQGEVGGVDVLVANAGNAVAAPLGRTTDEQWDAQIELNLTVPFRCMRAALPTMLERGWGRIVVIGSTASRQGMKYVAAYTAAKHGVLGLTRVAAAEVAGKGVTVNAVCPGYVDTPMTAASVKAVTERGRLDETQARQVFEEMQPIGRLIRPDEVARAVMFCVDDDADGVNGQGINVDGGAVTS